MSLAFVFPGQGSQSVGMMNAFADLPEVRQTFDEASAILGFDLWKMVGDGPDTDLNQTVNTQPAVLAAGMALWRAWVAGGGAQPVVAAGHSFGEVVALVATGAIAFSDALPLVKVRAELMQGAVEGVPAGMMAILGLDDATVVSVCAEAAHDQVCEAVNFNGPGQVVIAGHSSALERAGALAKDCGAKRALMLPVSIPGHCTLLRDAGERFDDHLQSVPVRAPAIPVIQNADRTAHTDPAAIRSALGRQLYSPVPWTATVGDMVAQGVSRIVECGPGKVLTGLNKRIAGEAECLALSDRATFDQLLGG
ncbi:MAG: ACP S-malonyltransferase [Burkholderiales bacterium]